MGVSNPTNFAHKVHVGYDPLSGGFTGLPDEWARLLNASAITKEDYARNPQAVIEVLEFYSKETARAGEMKQIQPIQSYSVTFPVLPKNPLHSFLFPAILHCVFSPFIPSMLLLTISSRMECRLVPVPHQRQ